MRNIFYATIAALFFSGCVAVSYGFGFGHGVDAAREACGRVIIQVGVDGQASLEVMKEMVQTICYQE